MNMDDRELAQYLAGRVAAHAQRARWQTCEEHGCTKSANRSTIDAFGIVCCQIASSRGLSVTVDSHHCPRQYLRAWDR